jgi:hypothetical protein
VVNFEGCLMPKYEYVIERFQRYDAWRRVSRTEDEQTFEAVWSSTRLLYRYGWIAILLIIIVTFFVAYRQFPAERVAMITLEEFGTYLRQNRDSGFELTASPCDMGIIGELDGEQIYWVELGYNGARWTATYDLPQSVWAEVCRPPIFIQYERLWLMLTTTVILALLYIAVNALATYRRWSVVQPITVRRHGDTVIITEAGQELNPASYEQLDERFKLPTANISIRRVIVAAIVFVVIGVLLSLIAAYII